MISRVSAAACVFAVLATLAIGWSADERRERRIAAAAKPALQLPTVFIDVQRTR